MNNKDIKLLEAILAAQNDMQLSEASDQYMRDLGQLIKQETAKKTPHRYREAFGEGTLNLSLGYCLVCGLNEGAKEFDRFIHLGFTRILVDTEGRFNRVLRRDQNNFRVPSGYTVLSVTDDVLGHLINGEAVYQKPPALLLYKDGMESTRPINRDEDEG